MFLLLCQLCSWKNWDLEMLGNFFKVVLIVKNLPTIARDKREAAFILKSRRSSGRGKWRRNKYSCLKNSMDKKSLVGYNSWPLAGYSSRHLKESDMTEQRNTHTHLKKTQGWGTNAFILILSQGCSVSTQLSWSVNIDSLPAEYSLLIPHNCTHLTRW